MPPVTTTTTTTTEVHNFTFGLAAVSAYPPCCAASFVVNSEPHTGARPSVRMCVGLIIRLQEHAWIAPTSSWLAFMAALAF